MAMVKKQDTDKARALQAALDQIERQFGKGAVIDRKSVV